MDCRETAFPNHNRVWSWTQVHWTAWFPVIHSWPKTRECDQLPTIFYMWTKPQFLVVQAQTFINESFCFPRQVHRFWFKILSLFLFNKILRMSLRRFKLIMTFFGELLKGKRWQSSNKVGSIGTSISSKISKTFASRPLSVTLAGIPDI